MMIIRKWLLCQIARLFGFRRIEHYDSDMLIFTPPLREG